MGQANSVQSNDGESESNYPFAVVNKTVMESIKLPRVNLQNSDSNCSFMVDSGASVNFVDSKTHWLLGLKSPLKPVGNSFYA